MKYRKLRIAWSVAWGVVAFLFAVWCVRDYHTSPQIIKEIVLEPNDFAFFHAPQWQLQNPSSPAPTMNVVFRKWYDYTLAGIPFWVIALSIALMGVLSWPPYECYRWRFSLRTLLIATTLVAVGLGFIMWAI